MSTPIKDPVLVARSRLGVAARTSGLDSAAAAEARRDLAAAKIERYVARVLADAPPLTSDQCERIVSVVEERAAS